MGENADAVKIIDAFTWLANTGRDVVAGAANAAFEDKIQITACVQPTTTSVSCSGDSQGGNSEENDSSIFSRLVSYLLVFVRNDKIQDPSSHSQTTSPTLNDAEAPDDLRGRSAIDYIVWLQSHW